MTTSPDNANHHSPPRNLAPGAAGGAPSSSFQLPEFRLLLGAVALSTLASRAMLVVIGYQVYEHTRDPLALGWLGLAEVIPAVFLALYGGHVADRNDRRRVVLATDFISVLCALLLIAISRQLELLGVAPVYGVVFLAGVARGFGDPAASAFEAQIVPRELYVNAATWLSSMWQACSIVGPTVAGFAYAWVGVSNTYVAIAVLFALAWGCIWLIAPKPKPEVVVGESMFASIAAGVKFVFRRQELVGSMALDLFAVFFGGAMALLPYFALDVLHVGPQGVGLLNAAPAVGSLAIMLWCTRFPPGRNAGLILHLCVAGFGCSMIVFALSEWFWLSLVALAASGVFDGVSVVIRKSILRILTPGPMRGRVSAVNSIFISSSNELGAFESGVAAKIFNPVPSVLLGAFITLLVVAVTAVAAPKLRQLNLLQRSPDDGE